MVELDSPQEEPPDRLLGAAILLLLLQQPDWVHRRVESVHFLDGRTMRRQVSTDYTIPGKDLTGADDLAVLPITLLEKKVLVNFNLIDEQGSSIPLLTRRENTYVAWSALVAAAEVEIQEQLGPSTTLDPALASELRSLAGISLEGAEAEMVRVLQPGNSQVEILTNSNLFMNFAWDLALNFLLLIPYNEEAGKRRIIKYSYAQELEPREGKRRERLLGNIGWIATQFDFDVPTVAASDSYHFEFAAPSGLPIAESSLRVDDAEGGGQVHHVTLAGARAHAYVSQQNPSARGVMSVWLWPSRSGLLRASWVTAAASTAIFWALLLNNRILELSGDSAAALLLAIPGVIAAFIVRPGEHGMVTALVRGIRIQVSLVGGAAYAGALALVGSLSSHVLLNVWKVLVLVTSLCFLSLSVAYLGIQPRTPEEMETEPGGENEDG